MKIDLRSDTVTQPTLAMKQAMFDAPLGDDVFGDDPSVLALEKYAAEMFGVESSLFCASGTMTNQIALMCHLSQGDEVIADALSHIYLYEGGGLMANSGASIKLLKGQNGLITSQMVAENINNPEDIHQPISRLVSLENTMNKGGGCFYDFSKILEIKELCAKSNLKLHLDGARLFNAIVETKETTLQYGEVFDSISICLSKGLGCPVGSLLLGNAQFIKKARRIRKRLGGGWRQAGFLATAGIFALQNHVSRLKEDHLKARAIGDVLKGLSYVENVYEIPTNIVIFETPNELLAVDFVSKAREQNLHCIAFGKNLVRFVTHLDFSDDHLDRTQLILRRIL
jgi:threonine aldolase